MRKWAVLTAQDQKKLKIFFKIDQNRLTKANKYDII